MCQIWHLMQTDQWGRAQTILMYYQKDRLRCDMMNNRGCKANGTSTGTKIRRLAHGRDACRVAAPDGSCGAVKLGA